jgi:hypothetical protein
MPFRNDQGMELLRPPCPGFLADVDFCAVRHARKRELTLRKEFSEHFSDPAVQ